MKIEVGKFYRTRDGRKVGPMALPKPDDVFRWNALGLRWGRWRDDGEDGNATGGTFEAGGDLIAEWIDPMDLTAITTPFGLLDRETQEALRAHGGPLEHWTGLGWHLSSDPYFASDTTYRAKPAPPKPREFWLRFDMNGTLPVVYGTPTEPTMAEGFVIHVREVLPE